MANIRIQDIATENTSAADTDRLPIDPATGGVTQWISWTTIKSKVQDFIVGITHTWTKAQRIAPSAITYAATINPDFALSNNFDCTLTGAVTVGLPTNIVAGQSGSIRLLQDATGGHTIAVHTSFKGTLPTIDTTAATLTTIYYDVLSATQIVFTVKTGVVA